MIKSPLKNHLNETLYKFKIMETLWLIRPKSNADFILVVQKFIQTFETENSMIYAAVKTAVWYKIKHKSLIFQEKNGRLYVYTADIIFRGISRAKCFNSIAAFSKILKNGSINISYEIASPLKNPFCNFRFSIETRPKGRRPIQ